MRRSPFLPALLIALVSIAAKTSLVVRSGIEPKGPIRIFAASAQDLVFCAVLGLVAAVALRLAKHHPLVRKTIWGLFIAIGTLAAAFSVVNIGILRTMFYPLNARMLQLVGRIGNLQFSIAEQAKFWLVASLVATIVLYPIAAHKGAVLFRSWRIKWPIIAIAMIWAGCGYARWAQVTPDHYLRRIAKNPHWEILSSAVVHTFSDGRIDIAEPFPPEYLDDFKPAAQRHCPALPGNPRPPRNVIVVVLESVTAQYLSMYGSYYDTTPNLIRESANALVCDRAYAHVGYTQYSRITLMHSVYPGVPWLYWYYAKKPLAQGMPSLLAEKGYRRAFFSTSFPDWDDLPWVAENAGFEKVYGPDDLGGAISSWGTEDHKMMDGLLKWIEADSSKPFYVMAWTDQTHHPYTLAKGVPVVNFGTKNDQMERHLNAIRQMDEQLGRLFEMLRQRNLADDTLVVITGDHGEAFGDLHDVCGHGTGIYDENLRVPLIFWSPRLFAGAPRDPKGVGHVDLNPTILHLMGITPPADWQGCSILSPDHPGRVYTQVELAGYQFAVNDGRYKYIMYLTDDVEQLFDLKEDPGEKKNVAKEHPDIIAKLRPRVSAFVKSEETYFQGDKRRP